MAVPTAALSAEAHPAGVWSDRAVRRPVVAPPGGRPEPLDAPDTPLSDVTFVVLDLETTGTVPGQSRIIEVAAAKYRGGECLGTFQTLVNPGCGLPPFIVALTGITEALVVPAPSIDEVLPTLLEFIGGAVLVGHNLRFDTSFLDADLIARGRPRLANARVDTLTLARRLVRDEVPDCRLGTLAARFHTVVRPTHRALDDVLATAEVLHALFERAAGYGVLALDDLLGLPSSPLALRKLPLLAGLPRAAGVYLFRGADGRVLHVGRAGDVRSRVRSLFVTGGRRKVARLLRETVAIEYRAAGHPLEAAVAQLRLSHAHRPWFDGRPRRWKACAYLKVTAGRFPRLAVVHTPRADGSVYLGPFPGVGPARFVRSAIEAALPVRRGAADVFDLVRRGLTEEPEAILGPLARRVEALTAAGHTGDAAFAQEQLRALTAALRRQAMLDGLRASGRLVVDVGGHHIELHDGRLVSVDGVAGAVAAAGPGRPRPGRPSQPARRPTNSWPSGAGCAARPGPARYGSPTPSTSAPPRRWPPSSKASTARA